MKLKMFLVFILTFILIPCVGYADTYYIYSKASDENLSNDIINTFCGNDLSNCTWVCNDDTELSGTLSPCNFNGGVKKVTAPGILDKIMEYSFGNTTIYQKMKDENYCPNTNNSDDICKSFRFDESGGGGRDESNVNYCYANLLGITHSGNDLNFNITIQPNIESESTPKLYFGSSESALGSSLTLDDTNKVVRYAGSMTNEYYFYSHGDSTKNEFVKEFKDRYYQSNTCPTVTFCLNTVSGSVNRWYAEFDSSCDGYRRIYYQTINTANGNNSGILSRSVDGADGDGIIRDEIEINSCEDFFGTDTEEGKKLVQLLAMVKNLIFIIVPIIVVALTIVDFTKAIFAGEDDMKKAQGKLFKRLLIAVVIFLIPTLIRLILWLANIVWPSISVDLCGIL